MKTKRETIPTKSLRLDMVPTIDSDIDNIFTFAISFDLDEINDISIIKDNPDFTNQEYSLEELRAYLYLEQRVWNHFMRYPNKKAMKKILTLLELIRKKLQT